MTTDVYLYESPFFLQTKPHNVQTYILDYLTEEDRQDENRIHALLLHYAVREKLVVPSDDNKLICPSIENKASLEYLVYYTNYRTLVDMNQYGKLMAALQSEKGQPLNQLIDLHGRLGMGFNRNLLNTLCHRTMTSVQLIPYEIDKKAPEVTWQRIHAETPFIWLLILLQSLFRSRF